MKKFFLVALMAAVCANAVAGNKSNNVVAKAASNKQQTVYVYKSANAHGIWYHVDTKCALKCKEYAVVEGKAMGISVTKENNAKSMGMMACPTCGKITEDLTMKLNKEILTLALVLGVSVSELQDTFSVFAADYKQEHSKVTKL